MFETLVFGGVIRPSASETVVEAMLVRDGIVAHLGTRAECASQALTQPAMFDVGERVVLPGFVDAHCHPLMYGQFLSWVACGWKTAPAISDVVRLLSERAQLQEGPVRGFGFHHGNVADQRMLTRHDLDQVATDREVMVFHSSGHGAIVNSWTLAERGIKKDTPDPDGGHFGRAPDGTPDGSMWDAAADWLTGESGVKITNNGPNFHVSDSEAELDLHLQIAQQDLLARGITSVVDAQVTSRELSAYLRAQNSGRMKIRSEMLVISSLLDDLENLGMGERFGNERLAIAGVKIYSDGALTAATARWSEPYCCTPEEFGFLYHANDELAQIIHRVNELGLVAATHAQGDAAIELVLQAFESLQLDQGTRHRIEHFGGPTADQVKRTKQVGLWPITQPQYLLHFGDELQRVLGDRAHRAFPLGEIRDAGIPIVISSDAPVCPPGPLEAVAAAVLRKTLGGVCLGTSEQRLTVPEALRAHTLTAAASINREHAVGSLEIGKHADFVVLESDPLNTTPEKIPAIQIAETWVGGEQVFSAQA